MIVGCVGLLLLLSSMVFIICLFMISLVMLVGMVVVCVRRLWVVVMMVCY